MAAAGARPGALTRVGQATMERPVLHRRRSAVTVGGSDWGSGATRVGTWWRGPVEEAEATAGPAARVSATVAAAKMLITGCLIFRGVARLVVMTVRLASPGPGCPCVLPRMDRLA